MVPAVLMALVATVQAGAPTAVVLPSQAVEGSVSVALAPADALARLADPTWVRSVDAGGTTVTIRQREGDCVVADYTSPSTLLTVRYTVRQCPTGHGYRSVLVASDTFATYDAEWIVAPDRTGSLLTYRIQLTPSFPLPVSFITGTIRRDILSMMERFHATFGPPA